MKNYIPVPTLGMTGLFALASLFYFWKVCPYHVVYQEQYQLFLFTEEYLAEMLSKPGGLADYLAAFCTQFLLDPLAGAAVITAFLCLLQRMTWRVTFRMVADDRWYASSFIPPLIYLYLMCDENYLLTGLVAPSIALFFFFVYVELEGNGRLWFYLALVPFLYILVGASAWVFALVCLVWDKRVGGRTWGFVTLGILWLLVWLVWFPYHLSGGGVPYPASRLWMGADFYRFPLLGFSVPVVLYLLSYVAVPWLASIPLRRPTALGLKLDFPIALLLYLAVVGGGGAIIYRATNWQKEAVMAYDYHTLHREWDKVIALADRRTPDSPLTVACLNLALCKEGMMPERMFHYYQNGTEGLLPTFTKDFTAPMVAAEVYYHIGFINTAQRFVFEAMECIPNQAKSSRALRRLVETNLVNGEYAVARKYLHILRHTLFHRQWAEKVLEALDGGIPMSCDPEWAELRRYRTKADYLYSEKEPDMMLGFTFQQDSTNRVAYEYLMAVCLLRKDLPSFLKYYPLGKSIGYKQIPRSYQEALIYAWGLTHKDMDGIPYPIHPSVRRAVEDYGRTYTTQRNAEPMLRSRYAGTYWYYLHYR